jgi:hypothetical protein
VLKTGAFQMLKMEKTVPLMISMLFIFSGCYKISFYAIAEYQSKVLSGVVVKQGMGRYMGCKPFIEFYDDKGLKREAKSDINYHFFFCPKEGDKIKLSISRESPLEIYNLNTFRYIIFPIFLISLGVSFIYITLKKAKSGGTTSACSRPR